MTVAPLPRIQDCGGLLPAAPLATIVTRDCATTYAEHGSDLEGANYARTRTPGMRLLMNLTGIDEKALGKIVRGETDTVTLDLADKYLCATGRHLRDVYPWLYSPEQIDADIAASEARDLGVSIKHRAACASRSGSECSCSPAYRADIWRGGTRHRKTFTRREDARAWRQEWTVRA